MLITAFYDSKDFFGNTSIMQEATVGVYVKSDIKSSLNKCLSALGAGFKNGFNVNGIAIDDGGFRYLIERGLSDIQNGVYTVTRCETCGNHTNTDAPVKMTAAAIRKKMEEIFED